MSEEGKFDHFKNFGTASIHAGQSAEKWDSNQIAAPISLSTTFKLSPYESKKDYYYYSEAGNPTRTAVEENLAALENAQFCRVFPSGMSAIFAITTLVKTDEHILTDEDIYSDTITLINKILKPTYNVDITYTDFTDIEKIQKGLKPTTKLVLIETPTNPTLKVFDIEEITKLVKAYNKDILVVVDNTFMSPYFQRPLTLGADLVIHSCTKYINGHADVIMGAVMTNDESIAAHLYLIQKNAGSVPSPFDCYLVMRGTKTLHIRMKTHFKNSLAVAKFLETHPKVEKVLYPQLESHPHHRIHKKQCRGMSGILSFYIKDDPNGELCKEFLYRLKLIQNATSLGAAESLATRYDPKYEEAPRKGVTPNLVRLSVGLEEKEDLIADLKQALDGLGQKASIENDEDSKSSGFGSASSSEYEVVA